MGRNPIGGPIRRRKRRDAQQLALRQGAFMVVGGLWPIVSLRSFEWVFGRKRDVYLQKTSGGLLLTAGLAQLASAIDGEVNAARRIGLAVACTYLAIDLIYVPKGEIPGTYLLDGLMEVGWIAAWLKRGAF